VVLGYGALTRPFALLLLALCALVLAYPGRRRISGLLAAVVFTVSVGHAQTTKPVKEFPQVFADSSNAP